MKRIATLIAAAALVALAAPEARALALFGTSLSNASGRMKSAERLLEKADTAFDRGELQAASNGYARAAEKFAVIARDYPEFSDGLAEIRMAYCVDQMNACGGNQAEPEAATAARKPDGESAADVFKAMTGEAAKEGAGAAAGQPEEAVEAPYNPRYFSYDFEEARNLIEKGRYVDAIEILVPMVKYDADNRQLRMLLATARLGTGQPSLAVETLEDLRGRREDLPLLLLISAAYTSCGRYPDALLALDTAAKRFPSEPDAYYNLAWLTLLMDGGSAEAKQLSREYYNQSLKRGARRDTALENSLGMN